MRQILAGAQDDDLPQSLMCQEGVKAVQLIAHKPQLFHSSFDGQDKCHQALVSDIDRPARPPSVTVGARHELGVICTQLGSKKPAVLTIELQENSGRVISTEERLAGTARTRLGPPNLDISRLKLRAANSGATTPAGFA